MTEGDREALIRRIHELAEDIKGVQRLSMDKLHQGDVLEIKTPRSLIKIKVLNPLAGIVLVDILNRETPITGEYESQEGTYGVLLGSNVEHRKASTAVINKGKLAVGFPIILNTGAKDLLQLSATQEVWLNGVRALPDFSQIRIKKPRF